MKKNLLLFFVVPFLLMGCKGEEMGVTDYRFKPTVQITGGEIYPASKSTPEECYLNSPITLTVSVEGSDALKMDYNVSYSFKSGGGSITLEDGLTLAPNKSIVRKLNNGGLQVVFTPTVAGDNEIEFTLANKEIKESVSLNLFVREQSYQIDFSNIPAKIIIEQKFSFNIDINLIKESHLENVKSFAKVTKGSGDIYIAEQAITDYTSPNLMKIGSSTVAYLPKTLQENTVQFDIEDIYGTLQKVPISFEVVKPNIDLSLVVDENTSPVINQDYSLKLNINKYEHPTNTFKMTYRFIKGSGAMRINGNNVEPGAQFNALAGDNIVIINTPTVGDVEIEFIVTDKFDTQKNIKYSSITTTESNQTSALIAENSIASPVNLGSEAPFTLALDEGNYDGKFKIKYNIVAGSGTLKLNGANVTDGATLTLEKGTHNFSFTPTTKGENKIKFVVTDEKTQTKTLNISVTGNPTAFIATNSTPGTVAAGTQSPFTITLDEPYYTGNFSVKYSLTAGTGTFKYNGAIVTNNAVFTIPNGTHNVSFTPAAVGDNTFTLTITDTYGQSKTLFINVESTTVALPDEINATTSVPPSVILGDKSAFTLILDEANYTGNFKITYNLLAGSGTLNNEITEVSNGSEIQLPKGTHNFSFTPTTKGTNTIQFTIIDSKLQTKTIKVNVTGNATPLVVSNTIAPSTGVGNESPFSVTISEEFYQGEFTIKYSLPTGSGTLKHEGVVLNNNTSVKVSSGTQNFSFTPSITGSNTIKLDITDDYGQTKSININVSSSASLIVASATTPPSAIVGGTSSFNLTVNEEFYSGKFNIKADIIAGSGTLKQGTTTVSNGGVVQLANGTHGFTFTPTSVGVNTIRFTITDTNNQTKTVDVNVTGNSSSIVASATTPTSVLAGNESSFNLTVNEEFYSGKFNIKADIIAGSGTLKQGTTTVSNGGVVQLANGTHGFTFTPTSVGSHTIRFTITDTNSQTQTVNVIVLGNTHPINASSVNFNGIAHTSNSFSLTIDAKQFYSGNYTITAQMLSGAGVVKYGATTLSATNGVTLPIGTHNFSFTPTSVGNLSIRLIIKDDQGGIKTLDVGATITAYLLKLKSTVRVAQDIKVPAGTDLFRDITNVFASAYTADGSPVPENLKVTLKMSYNTVYVPFTTAGATVTTQINPYTENISVNVSTSNNTSGEQLVKKYEGYIYHSYRKGCYGEGTSIENNAVTISNISILPNQNSNGSIQYVLIE